MVTDIAEVVQVTVCPFWTMSIILEILVLEGLVPVPSLFERQFEAVVGLLKDPIE